MRLVFAIAFILFSAFIGWAVATTVINSYFGIVLLVPIVLGSAFLYLIFFDSLIKIVDPTNKNTYKPSSESKEYVFGISLVLSAALASLLHLYLINRHTEITVAVEKKNIITTGRAGRRLYCRELQLKAGISECVNHQCWDAVKEGSIISITPSKGLLGVRKMDTPCKAEL